MKIAEGYFWNGFCWNSRNSLGSGCPEVVGVYENRRGVFWGYSFCWNCRNCRNSLGSGCPDAVGVYENRRGVFLERFLLKFAGSVCIYCQKMKNVLQEGAELWPKVIVFIAHNQLQQKIEWIRVCRYCLCSRTTSRNFLNSIAGGLKNKMYTAWS